MAWGSQQNLRPYERRGSPVRSGGPIGQCMAMLGESRTNSSLHDKTSTVIYINIWNYMNHNFLCQNLSLLMSLVWVFTKRIIVPRGHVSSPVKLFNLGPLWGISLIGLGVVVMKSPCLETCVLLLVFNNTCLFFKIPRHWERTTTPFSPEKSWKTHGKPGWQSILVCEGSPSGFLHVSLLDCLAS